MEQPAKPNVRKILDTTDFVNHRSRSELHVSSIYDWFESDFGNSEKGVIIHLKRYAEPGLAAQLETTEEIEDSDCDWALNDSSQAGHS